MKTIAILIAGLLTLNVASAAPSVSADKLKAIQDAANAFLVKQQVDHMIFNKNQKALVKAQSLIPLTNCPPVTPPSASSCIDSVCDKLGSGDCDDTWEIQSVANMCKGQPDGICVDMVCDKLGSGDCDDTWEIQSVLGTCKSTSGPCIGLVCDNLGSGDCDDSWEIQSVASMCKPGTDVGCIAAVCNQLGAGDCDDTWEIQSVISTCSGN